LNNEEKRSVENLVLAIVRTELANRRTLLAYLNTALALFVSGIGMLKLTEDNWLEWLGFALVPVSIVVAIIGVVDFPPNGFKPPASSRFASAKLSLDLLS